MIDISGMLPLLINEETPSKRGCAQGIMEGIGFKFEKVFANKEVLHYSKGNFYCAMVSIGPFIPVAAMLGGIQLMLAGMDKPFELRQLFVVPVIYAFIFSQLAASGFTMLINRFVADKLSLKHHDDIVPSLFGMISLVTVVGALPAVLFLWSSPLSVWVKLATYILYMQLTIMWVFMVYLSALKEYQKTIKVFLAGVIIALMPAYLVIKWGFVSIPLGLFWSMDAGLLFINIIDFIFITHFFEGNSEQHFLFLGHFQRASSLFFINLFYTGGLYIHNILMWHSPLGHSVARTYVYAPLYDIPAFLAFLSVLPAMVMFVILMETSFYKKYQVYFSYMTNDGNLSQITRARKEMLVLLWAKLADLLEVQLVFSLLAVILGNFLLPQWGFDNQALNIFNLLALGDYLSCLLLIVIIIQLYFGDRRGALAVAALFLLTNTSFTWYSIGLGEQFYGWGFVAASFVALLLGLQRSIYYLNRMDDYYVFCSRSMQ